MHYGNSSDFSDWKLVKPGNLVQKPVYLYPMSRLFK